MNIIILIFSSVLFNQVPFCGGANFVRPGPEFVVAGINQQALVDCTLDMYVPDIVISEFSSDTTGNIIYLGPTTNISDGYVVNGFYNLTVLNTTVVDGGLYKCDIRNGNPKFNYVTVMEKPNLVVNGMVENELTTVTCSATYGSEVDNPDLISPQGPILTISYNKTPLFNATMGTREQNTDPKYKGNYLTPFTGTQNYNFSRNDAGNNISCAFFVVDPPFEFATTFTLDIYYLDIPDAVVNETHEIGDSIQCNFDGNPTPGVTWIAVNTSASTQLINGSILNVTSDMVGWNVWMCQVENIINGNRTTESVVVSFYVGAPLVESTPNPMTTQPEMTTVVMTTQPEMTTVVMTTTTPAMTTMTTTPGTTTAMPTTAGQQSTEKATIGPTLTPNTAGSQSTSITSTTTTTPGGNSSSTTTVTTTTSSGGTGGSSLSTLSSTTSATTRGTGISNNPTASTTSPDEPKGCPAGANCIRPYLLFPLLLVVISLLLKRPHLEDK